MLAGTVLARQNSRPALCASLLRETPEGRTGRARSHGMRLSCSCDSTVPCRWGCDPVLKVPGSAASCPHLTGCAHARSPGCSHQQLPSSAGPCPRVPLCQAPLCAAGMLTPSSLHALPCTVPHSTQTVTLPGLEGTEAARTVAAELHAAFSSCALLHHQQDTASPQLSLPLGLFSFEPLPVAVSHEFPAAHTHAPRAAFRDACTHRAGTPGTCTRQGRQGTSTLI